MLDSTRDELRRAQYLPAYVEIMLAAGALDLAEAGCSELESTARRFGTEILCALADQARGRSTWHEATRPRRCPACAGHSSSGNSSRLRVLLARACAAAGDCDGTELELSAARATFEKLGAAHDLAGLAVASAPDRPHAQRLSARELEVLKLLATGQTNKEIARALFVSDKTVDRHVSNIFAKLDVRTRAAATAYAFQHKLL